MILLKIIGAGFVAFCVVMIVVMLAETPHEIDKNDENF